MQNKEISHKIDSITNNKFAVPQDISVFKNLDIKIIRHVTITKVEKTEHSAKQKSINEQNLLFQKSKK